MVYKLKVAAKRGSALLGAIGLLVGVGTSAIPAFVSADSLNPLTERSLTLSSSSPGWAYTDGSGNSTYAGPNTGTNGQKTGNTFSFRTSSVQTIKAFSFQYCTTSAGACAAPGTDTPEVYQTSPFDGTTIATPRGSDDTTSHSDLVTHVDGTTNAEVTGAGYQTLSANTTATSTGAGTGATASQYGDVVQVPDAQDTVSPYDQSAFGHANNSNGVTGNFVVLTGTKATGYVNTYSGGWTLSATDQQEAPINNTTGATDRTGKDNMMTLTVDGTDNTGVPLGAGDYVKVIFFGTDKNYITNPGAGAFFVKINDYPDTAYQNWADNLPNAPVDGSTDYTCGTKDMGVKNGSEDCPANVVDGGVTVANVMNQSIEIQTKVLETMDFSVGTVDPDTLTDVALNSATAGKYIHAGACVPILTSATNGGPANVLTMGNPSAENSLDTGHTYVTHSFWRLSSNSSGGATVYYAGNTLSNTEGDMIAGFGDTAVAPSIGTAQFGLALDNGTGTDLNYPVNYSLAHVSGDTVPIPLEADADGGAGLSSDFTTYQAAHPAAVHLPQLAPLAPTANYGGGTGGVNGVDTAALDGGTGDGITTDFAFDPISQTVPIPIATESTNVVDCVTGKMRYAANIAATTPAGIYTTKINYIAAPQY